MVVGGINAPACLWVFVQQLNVRLAVAPRVLTAVTGSADSASEFYDMSTSAY